MTDPRGRYQESLSAFAVPGNRWNGTLALTYWATAAGVDTEAVLADAHGVGVHDRDGDIRRGMKSAMAKINAYAATHGISRGRSIGRHATPAGARSGRTSALRPQHSKRVRQLIEAGHDVSTFDALRELSPVRIRSGHDRLALEAQCELQLLTYFRRNDVIHVFRLDAPSAGEPGKNIMTLDEWLTRQPCVHPIDAGEIVRPNPLSGVVGQTKEGKSSYIAQSCIADYRHMIFEFDGMPIADQCRFWGGVIRQGNLPLVSLAYSGSKSIHGVLRADAPDVETWMRCRRAVVDLFATDADPCYRLDPQALHPLTGTRLAGATRASTGKVQELLWISQDWRDTDRGRTVASSPKYCFCKGLKG